MIDMSKERRDIALESVLRFVAAREGRPYEKIVEAYLGVNPFETDLHTLVDTTVAFISAELHELDNRQCEEAKSFCGCMMCLHHTEPYPKAAS